MNFSFTKYLFFVLGLLVFQTCPGQTIKFQLSRVNSCNPAGAIDSSFYFLSDKDSNYYSESGVVYLPGPGRYKIFMFTEPATEFPIVEINAQEFYTYVYNEPKIVARSYGIHPQTVYETCGEPIDGYQTDYYPNGNIRIRGTFINGKPKDSLVTFYPNGVVKKRLLFSGKEIFSEEYDSLFNLVKVIHNRNKAYFLTDYDMIEYHGNGKVKLIQSETDGFVLIKEFFQNGQLKTEQAKKYRFEYFENGKLSTRYKWKRKRIKEAGGGHSFEFKVFKTSFDFLGNKLEAISFENWYNKGFQPVLEIKRSDWINKWVKYERGKPVIIARSISVEKYLIYKKNEGVEINNNSTKDF